MKSGIHSLHDAEILSVSWRGNDLELKIVRESDEIVLRLMEAAIVRLADFGVQNIVERLWTSAGNEWDADFFRERLIWATSAVDAPSYLSDSRSSEILESLRGSDLLMVGLVPSIGAELVAVCKRFDVVPQVSRSNEM